MFDRKVDLQNYPFGWLRFKIIHLVDYVSKSSIWLITFQNYPIGWLRFKIIHLVDYVSKSSIWLITFQNYPIGWLHFEIEPILNVHFSLKFSNYTSLKRFLCLKWILKIFSTILHSQFKYHTLPVTPFK